MCKTLSRVSNLSNANSEIEAEIEKNYKESDDVKVAVGVFSKRENTLC